MSYSNQNYFQNLNDCKIRKEQHMHQPKKKLSALLLGFAIFAGCSGILGCAGIRNSAYIQSGMYTASGSDYADVTQRSRESADLSSKGLDKPIGKTFDHYQEATQQAQAALTSKIMRLKLNGDYRIGNLCKQYPSLRERVIDLIGQAKIVKKGYTGTMTYSVTIAVEITQDFLQAFYDEIEFIERQKQRTSQDSQEK
jgi:hypothetical protein